MVESVFCVSSTFTLFYKSMTSFQRFNQSQDAESNHGDPVTVLNLLNDWLEQKGAGEDTRGWCKRRGIEEQRWVVVSGGGWW